MRTIRLSVAKDFSPVPGPRMIEDGPYSGEKFFKSVLLPALEKCDELVVDLDGTAGYGSSFLDEAFGSLVRIAGYKVNEVLTKIKIVSDEDPYYAEEAIDSIKSAK